MYLFARTDFNAFHDPTLDGRMADIRRDIDPLFVKAAPIMNRVLTTAGIPEQVVHIAKHARRHKNPPPNTWVALSDHQRGYKMGPHIELGMWDDRLFLWVALLAESKAKPDHVDWTKLREQALHLPETFEICGNHTQKAVLPVNAATFDQLATRYQTTKKGEWLIGQTYLLADPLYDAPDELWADILERLEILAPLYQTLRTGFA